MCLLTMLCNFSAEEDPQPKKITRRINAYFTIDNLSKVFLEHCLSEL